MDMDEVQEILKKHNELLDSMTDEERVKFYASFGMKINPQKARKTDSQKKINNKENPVVPAKNDSVVTHLLRKRKPKRPISVAAKNPTKKNKQIIVVNEPAVVDTSLDTSLRRFKRSCAKSGVLAEVRKREHSERPSAKRKKKSVAARKRKR